MSEEAWKVRLQSRMNALQHTMKSLSLAAGLGETGVRDILKRTHSPSVDALAKISRALGMTLTELYEGPTVAGAERLYSIDIVGETLDGGGRWFQLSGKHFIVESSAGRIVNFLDKPDLVAIYHRDSVVVFKKIEAKAVQTGPNTKEHLILTKQDIRYFTVVESKEKDTFIIARHGIEIEEIELPFDDIRWIGEWSHAAPRRLIQR